MENQISGGITGKLVRTAVLAAAAVIAAQHQAPSVQACQTCEWNVNGGYSCIDYNPGYYGCYLDDSDCTLGSEGCC